MMPSASRFFTGLAPEIAGNTDGSMFESTTESITAPSLAPKPADTDACTSATAPPTITMYVPEQIDRASSMSTLAALSMASDAA